MARPSDALSQSPNLKNLGGSFRLVGWISFWIQAILGVVSGGLVLMAFVTSVSGESQASNPLGGLGLLFTVGGLLAMWLSAFWSFRYTRWGRRFLAPAEAFPSKAETLKFIKLVLVTDLAGILVTFIAVFSSVGVSIGKILANGAVSFPQSSRQLVEPIDLLLIQACVNVLAGLFAGVVASLWLLQRTTQQRPSR